MQVVVFDGQEVTAMSYDDLRECIQRLGWDTSLSQDTDSIWGTLVTLTKGITAVHLGCQKKYLECGCENQVLRTGLTRYHINLSSISNTKGELRQKLRVLVREWVIPCTQLNSVAMPGITSTWHSYKQKVVEAAQALLALGQGEHV